jgi:hypothetical protein
MYDLFFTFFSVYFHGLHVLTFYSRFIPDTSPNYHFSTIASLLQSTKLSTMGQSAPLTEKNLPDQSSKASSLGLLKLRRESLS